LLPLLVTFACYLCLLPLLVTFACYLCLLPLLVTFRKGGLMVRTVFTVGFCVRPPSAINSQLAKTRLQMTLFSQYCIASDQI
jgi:hypothetical protein